MEKGEKIVMKHRDRLEQHATKSELRFMQFLLSKNTPFQFQKMIRGESGRWYIVDFYLHEFRVVIEIDGHYHLNERQARSDKERTHDLEKFGYKVLRLLNEQTKLPYNELAAVINRKYMNYAPSVYYRTPEKFLTKPPKMTIFKLRK